MLRRLVLVLLVAGVAAVLVTACRETQPNQPPEVALRSDFAARLGHLVPVVASASDADGDALDYRWELLSTPDGAAPTLDTEGGHVVVLSADTAGEYELRVVVDDGQATASDAVVITFDPDFELGPWAAMSASPYVIPEIASVYLPDPATGDPVLTEVAVLAGFVVQGGDLVLGRLEDFDGVAPSSFVRESAKFPSSEIPYEFKEDEYSEAAKADVKSALAVLAAETGVLTFTDVTGQGFNGLRIRFIRTSVSALQGCWGEKNPVLWPGVRAVNLGDGCLNERTIKHEVLHALGFYHEHQRRDRDTYVEVTPAPPDPSLKARALYLLNHEKPLDGSASAAYDWRSIMHYPFGPDDFGWSLSPRDGALPETVSFGDVGRLVPLSAGDIEAVRKLYGSHTDPTANLAGPVYGYDGTADLTVLAISFSDDETTLASGTLFAAPNSRVQADLTPLSEVPASALSGNIFCPEVQVTPANLKGAELPFLFVLDGDAAIGQLFYANFNPAIIERAPGDAVYWYFLVDVAGSYRGTCGFTSHTQTYDLDLAKGWNAVRWQVDAVDPSGVRTEMSLTIGTPPSNAAWYFIEFAEPDAPSE